MADATAWISAGSAVVQAVGAVVAIVYSGKLARDAASREKAADEANSRRIEEANAAAVEQRRLDTEAAELREMEAGRSRHNEPIVTSIDAATLAVNEMRVSLAEHERLIDDSSLRDQSPGVNQQIAINRIFSASQYTGDAKVAASLFKLSELFTPWSPTLFKTSREWSQILGDRVKEIDEVIDEALAHLW